jgi:hypothetical protein
VHVNELNVKIQYLLSEDLMTWCANII